MSRRRVITALVLLGAVAVGVVFGLILVAPGGDQAGPLTPSPPPASAPAPEPSSSAPDSAVAAAAQDIADAINDGNADEYGRLTCRPQPAGALAQLQQRWNAAGGVHAGVLGPPAVTGDRAQVTIRVQGAGGHRDTVFPLTRQGARWCVPG